MRGKPGDPRRPRNNPAGENASGEGRTTPGPRPLGARQRARQQAEDAERREREQAARLGRGTSALGSQPAAPPPGPVPSAPTKPERTVRKVRDAGAVRRRALRRNRRSLRWAPLLFQIACGLFAVECLAALLFSPHLNVRTVVVQGNGTVPTEQLLKRLGPVRGKNIVRLPTRRMTEAALAEPTVEAADVRREWPDRVTLVVKERVPWASVQTPDGACYTIDAKMIPFRTGDAPEAGLPNLRLAPAPDGRAPLVTLGVPMTAPGLSEVARCLAWATARPDFLLESVTIDSEGKLCLNRKGGVEVQLGTGSDLSKKLASLELPLERRPGLRTGTEVAYVNLFAYDAPALMPRPVSVPATTAPLPRSPAAETVVPARLRSAVRRSNNRRLRPPVRRNRRQNRTRQL